METHYTDMAVFLHFKKSHENIEKWDTGAYGKIYDCIDAKTKQPRIIKVQTSDKAHKIECDVMAKAKKKKKSGLMYAIEVGEIPIKAKG